MIGPLAGIAFDAVDHHENEMALNRLRIPLRLDALAGGRGLEMPCDHVLEIATGVIGQPQVILYPRPNPRRIAE